MLCIGCFGLPEDIVTRNAQRFDRAHTCTPHLTISRKDSAPLRSQQAKKPMGKQENSRGIFTLLFTPHLE